MSPFAREDLHDGPLPVQSDPADPQPSGRGPAVQGLVRRGAAAPPPMPWGRGLLPRFAPPPRADGVGTDADFAELWSALSGQRAPQSLFAVHRLEECGDEAVRRLRA